MNIAAASKQYDIPADTLRYYERVGIIPPVTRDERGYRNFTERDLRWVYFAKVMRNAGVSVESMIEYVSLFRKGREETAEARKKILIEQKQQLEERIEVMNDTLQYLNYKIEGTDNHLAEYEKLLENEGE